MRKKLKRYKKKGKFWTKETIKPKEETENTRGDFLPLATIRSKVAWGVKTKIEQT